MTRSLRKLSLHVTITLRISISIATRAAEIGREYIFSSDIKIMLCYETILENVIVLLEYLKGNDLGVST